MPKINVFACPSCGASLSVDDDGSATTVCQFCGNTVIIPEELRSRPAAPAFPVVGPTANAVFRFSPEGKFVNRFGSDGDGKGQFRAPNAIAVDGQSRVYVSDIRGIQVFDADGRYLASIGVPNSGVVFGMVFDDQNALYVVANNSKVLKFEINP